MVSILCRHSTLFQIDVEKKQTILHHGVEVGGMLVQAHHEMSTVQPRFRLLECRRLLTKCHKEEQRGAIVPETIRLMLLLPLATQNYLTRVLIRDVVC